MSTALGGQADADTGSARIFRAWSDFVNGALTLADGGRRVAGVEPVSVGSAVGVLCACADVAPDAAQRFSAIPASLAAVIGMALSSPATCWEWQHCASRCTAPTPIRCSVSSPSRDQRSGSLAGTTAKSYTWQAAAILVDFLGRARAEVTTLVGGSVR